jgi:hypothetical protein
MVQSDALSCRPDLCPEDDNDNEDIVMLPDAMFLNLLDLALQDKITSSTDLDQPHNSVNSSQYLNKNLHVFTPLRKEKPTIGRFFKTPLIKVRPLF